MPDYIFLMHDDSIADDAAWEPYLTALRQRGAFQGGSAIGDGACLRRQGQPAAMTRVSFRMSRLLSGKCAASSRKCPCLFGLPPPRGITNSRDSSLA